MVDTKNNYGSIVGDGLNFGSGTVNNRFGDRRVELPAAVAESLQALTDALEREGLTDKASISTAMREVEVSRRGDDRRGVTARLSHLVQLSKDFATGGTAVAGLAEALGKAVQAWTR